MAKNYKAVDLSHLKTFPIGRRAHKFDIKGQAGLPPQGASFREWWDSLPAYLGAVAVKAVAAAIVEARLADRPVVFALGAHVVKAGCSPIVCDLIERRIVTAVALHGATAIHDIEVATIGQTSEEVADTLHDGRFGMVQETPLFFSEAMKRAPAELGLGAALGRHLLDSKASNAALSILGTAHRIGIPATVHVALGTDTIHMHANIAESELGRLSMVDFRILCSVVADMAPSRPGGAPGVWCNIGSAVVLPEVFLKAFGAARNLGADLAALVTANFDMIRQYRPSENVIGRPVKKGRGHQVIGHHEIMLPMLRQAILETQPAVKGRSS